MQAAYDFLQALLDFFDDVLISLLLEGEGEGEGEGESKKTVPIVYM